MRTFVVLALLGCVSAAPFLQDTPAVVAERARFQQLFNAQAAAAAAAPDDPTHGGHRHAGVVHHQQAAHHVPHTQQFTAKWTGPVAATVPAGLPGSAAQVSDTADVSAARNAFLAAYRAQVAATTGQNVAPVQHHQPSFSAPRPVQHSAHNFNAIQPTQAKWTGPVAATIPAGVNGKITPVGHTPEVAAARNAFFSSFNAALASTQPAAAHSFIRVSHPAGTSHGLSDFIRRISLERTCVTPVVTNARQQRNYFLSACIRYDDINARTSANDAIQNLSITSFFHRGGGDHSFTFGTSEHSVKTRALVFPQPENTNPRRVLFRVLEDAQFSQTRYLHDVAVYAALEWACNRDVSTQTCAQLAETVRVVRRERVTRKVIYWEGREETVAESVDGLRSEFHVRLEAPSRAVQAAGRVFATSAVVEEVAARGDFTDVTNERRVPGLAGMISEEGRVASVPLLAMLAAIAVACVAILRALLRPISLAQAARRGLLSQRAEASDETMDGRGADAHVEIEAVLDDGFDERARDVR